MELETGSKPAPLRRFVEQPIHDVVLGGQRQPVGTV